MKEQDEIDHLFQDTFNGFEVIPDPSVKEKIDQSIASGKRRRRFLLIFFPLIALSMTGIIIGMLYKSKPSGVATVISHEKTESTKTESLETYTGKENHSLAVNSTVDEVVKRTVYAPTSQWDGSYNPSFQKNRKTNEETDRKFVEEQVFEVIEQKQRMNPLHTENNVTDTTTHVPDIALSDSSDVKSPDSAIVQNERPKDQETIKTNSRWYITGFAGWEGERTQPFEAIDSNNLSSAGKEFAYMRSSSFYGKVEINRQLGAGFDVITGFGFRSTMIQQQGTRYVFDSISNSDGVVTATPTTYLYFINRIEGQQRFRVNALTLPVGIAYTVPIGRLFSIRCAAGTEFAYGWLKQIQLQSDFTRPVFRPFGWNIWLRPELHCTVGPNVRVIAYGSMNHALHQQLKWDVTSKRNPLFGAGIGVSVRL